MTRLRSGLSFGPAIAFLRRRLSPEGYLGLYLTIGVDLAPNGDSADSCRVNEAVFGAGSRRD